MATPSDVVPSGGTVNLPFLVLARICTSAIFMTYPACLNALLSEWRMTATQAGIVQGSFMAAFAVSLLVASYLCDRTGAKRVFNAATLLSAIASVLFALFAQSFGSAVFLVFLVGLTQGGTYTPAIMLVSANAPPDKKASAVGWVLAGMSAGYVISISLATAMLAQYGYRSAFLATASITVFGWVFGWIAVKRARDPDDPESPAETVFDAAMKRRAKLLTLGYIGHSWELLGAWAWIPAFLTAAILARDILSPFELGLWIALTLHLSGFFASFLSGYAADRFGARRVLIAFGLLGLVCSLSIGWFSAAGIALLLALTAIYGFATIGDSAVLSSAMTDAVPASVLGRALGIRSVLGIGAGAVSPALFGLTLDLSPAGLAWGYAFFTLAVGAALAVLCAVLLDR